MWRYAPAALAELEPRWLGAHREDLRRASPRWPASPLDLLPISINLPAHLAPSQIFAEMARIRSEAKATARIQAIQRGKLARAQAAHVKAARPAAEGLRRHLSRRRRTRLLAVLRAATRALWAARTATPGGEISGCEARSLAWPNLDGQGEAAACKGC